MLLVDGFLVQKYSAIVLNTYDVNLSKTMGCAEIAERASLTWKSVISTIFDLSKIL